MTPGINPIYAGLERSCPRDSKNAPYKLQFLMQLYEAMVGLKKNKYKYTQFPLRSHICLNLNLKVWKLGGKRVSVGETGC